jgi:hypothetical protein
MYYVHLVRRRTMLVVRNAVVALKGRWAKVKVYILVENIPTRLEEGLTVKSLGKVEWDQRFVNEVP